MPYKRKTPKGLKYSTSVFDKANDKEINVLFNTQRQAMQAEEKIRSQLQDGTYLPALATLAEEVSTLEREKAELAKKSRPSPPAGKNATKTAGHQAIAAALVLGFYAIQEEVRWPIASEEFLTSEPVNTGLMVLISVILGTLLGKK